MSQKNNFYDVAKNDFFISKTSNVICRKFWILQHSTRHKKTDLANLKSDVDNLDIDNLINISSNLRNLKSTKQKYKSIN